MTSLGETELSKAVPFTSADEFVAIATTSGEKGTRVYRPNVFVVAHGRLASTLSLNALATMLEQVANTVSKTPASADRNELDQGLAAVFAATSSASESTAEKNERARRALLQVVCEHLLTRTGRDGTPFGGLRHVGGHILLPSPSLKHLPALEHQSPRQHSPPPPPDQSHDGTSQSQRTSKPQQDQCSPSSASDTIGRKRPASAIDAADGIVACSEIPPTASDHSTERLLTDAVVGGSSTSGLLCTTSTQMDSSCLSSSYPSGCPGEAVEKPESRASDEPADLVVPVAAGRRRVAPILSMEALLTALNNVGSVGNEQPHQQWYVSTKHLQLVCLELCAACRAREASHMVVTADTPPYFWRRRDVEDHLNERTFSRVPTLRVGAITWKISIALLSKGRRLVEEASMARLRDVMVHGRQSVDEKAMCPQASQLMLEEGSSQELEEIIWPCSLERLSLTSGVNEVIDHVMWPARLQQLMLGPQFNHPVNVIEWPASLQELEFGDAFNTSIDEITWPPLLRKLIFGKCFNKPIESVKWPNSLLHLSFGRTFNQAVNRVVWPASVETVAFGDLFYQPLQDVIWPVSLQQLKLGGYLKRPILMVMWPARLQQGITGYHHGKAITRIVFPESLTTLGFGWDFNLPIDNVMWPSSLKQLVFGRNFNQPITYVEWPSSLAQLTFGWNFNQSVDGVVWPASLRHLIFNQDFNQPIDNVSWPSSLQELSFGRSFNQPIDHVGWPAGLQKLAFGWKFNQPISAVLWPTSLRVLTFGHDFNQAISAVRWPASLLDLTFGYTFNQPIINMRWPPSLREITFGHAFKHCLDDVVWPASLESIVDLKFHFPRWEN